MTGQPNENGGFRAQVVRCAVVEKLLRTSLLLINRKNVHRIRATLVCGISEAVVNRLMCNINIEYYAFMVDD